MENRSDTFLGMVIVNESGLISYTPSFDAAGIYTIEVLATDPDGLQDLQRFSLDVANVNRSPIAHSQTIETNENTEIQILLSGDDIDSDPISYQITSQPKNGVLSGIAPNLVYTPNTNFDGTDSLEFSVNDGTVDSTPSEVLINVMNINHAPVITSTPVGFVLAGDVWTYALVATDEDGDDITLSAPTLPDNATFDAQIGLVTWSTTDLAVGNYAFHFVAQDVEGLSIDQQIKVEVLSTERTITHEGTEFRVPFSINFQKINYSGTLSDYSNTSYHIFMVSNNQDTNVSLDIPLLGISETLSLTKGVITKYTVAAKDVYDAGGYERNTILKNQAIHIQADENISVYVLNQQLYTTDGFLALPVAALGKQYIVGHYKVHGSGNHEWLDPIAGIFATQDNTQISIKATMDMFFGENAEDHTYGQVNTGDIFTLSLDAGDVFNLRASGSRHADFTGTLITADKPIGLLGQVPCTIVPDGFDACDHLVEQLPPIESLGVNYLTAPLYGRGGNDTNSGGYGEVFRIVAPYDNTEIYIDGEYRKTINSQEYFEFFAQSKAQRKNTASTAQKPLQIHTSQPVLLLQYSTGSDFDRRDPDRKIASELTDPFMVVVPPVEQYLNKYTVNTPTVDIERNFINLLMPDNTISTATMNAMPIAVDNFIPIPGSDYSYAQIEVEQGSYTLEADQPFGVYVYGNEYYESYGYLGGMAFSLPDSVDQLTLTGDASRPLGAELCLNAQVNDALGRPVHGVRVKFAISGTQSTDAYVFSDNSGVAQHCYSSYQIGNDLVSVTVGVHSQTHTVNWTAAVENQPPVIVSLPTLEAEYADSYQYQIVAIDPNNDALTYTLIQDEVGSGSMTLSDDGLLEAPNLHLSTTSMETVIVEVSDSHGASTRQSFRLIKKGQIGNSMDTRTYFNTPPVFTEIPYNTVGTVGVPYVYNLALLEHSLDYPKYEIPYTDHHDDAVNISFVNAPAEVYAENNPGYDPSCRCQKYMRWIPTAPGNYQFDMIMRDSRGQDASNIRSFNVNIAANLPPSIVSTNPPTMAVVGQEYTYVIDIQNDIPIGSFSNLDNLQVVMEQAPSSMRTYLARSAEPQDSRYYLTWRPTASDIGLHPIRIRVDDRVNSSPVQEFTINVIDDNLPPVITSTANKNAEVSIPYAYQVLATDPDGDPLSYELLIGVEGMEISETGLITWLPTAEDMVREHSQPITVWVAVNDGRGGNTIQKYQLSLSKFYNQAPKIISDIRVAQAQVGVEYVIQVQADDRENGTLSYAPYFRNDVLIEVSETGVIRWTPTEVGIFTIGVRIQDPENRFVDEIWEVTVVDSADAPNAELGLINKPLISAFIGKNYRYRFYGGSSLEGHVVASLVDGPSGMTITPNQPFEGAYELNWIPEEANCKRDVKLVLMDGFGNTEQVNYTIDVYSAPKRQNRFQCSVDAEFCATR